MQALRLAAPALALAVVLSSAFLALGFASGVRTTGDAIHHSPNDSGPPAGTASTAGTFADRPPAEDVRGKPISGLPRQPGSVRVAYSEERADGLSVVRASYLTEGSPGAVRDFYAGVFESGRWETANVEYAGGEWYLLATSGTREAVVEAAARGGRSVARVEVSRPLDQEEDGASAGGSKR